MLAFWFCGTSPMDAAQVWTNFGSYGFTEGSLPGELGLAVNPTNGQVQKAVRKRYNDAGVKILVSAFGSTEFPTSRGMNATDCGIRLGKYVNENNLDGADADW
jgi:hypothetical protein